MTKHPVKTNSNKDLPELSIIIPVFNAEPYLERCLDSLLPQLDSRAEVILVDDGSTDDSVAIIEKYLETSSRITHIKNHHSGVSAARNAGLDRAAGNYIAWVDSDDYVSSDWYSEITRALGSHPDILCFDWVNEYKRSSVVKAHWSVPGPIDKDAYIYSLCNGKSMSYLHIRVFARSLFDGLRFNEHITVMEDYELLTKLVFRAKSLYCLKKPLYHYIIRKVSTSHGCDPEVEAKCLRISESRVDFFRSHGIDVPESECLQRRISICLKLLRQHDEKRLFELYSENLAYLRGNMGKVLSDKNLSPKTRVAAALLVLGIAKLAVSVFDALKKLRTILVGGGRASLTSARDYRSSYYPYALAYAHGK